MILTWLSPELRRFFGAIERALYVAIIGWLTIFALTCTLKVSQHSTTSRTGMLAQNGVTGGWGTALRRWPFSDTLWGMCRAATCRKCGRPTLKGCGAHVEQVLGDVPPAERCRCRSAKAPATKRKSWLSR
jgi:hypothetical protein